MLKITTSLCFLLLSVHAVCTQPVFAYRADNPPQAEALLKKEMVHHLQSVLAAYQEIYSRLIANDASGMAASASKLDDAAKACIDQEPEVAIGRLMQHVIQGAEELINAGDDHEIQGGFASISNALFSFFKLRPNQLKTLEIKLYWCKKDGYYWLQPQKQPPACPYSAGAVCPSIEEVI